jgi:peptide/nickel transport system permease protein
MVMPAIVLGTGLSAILMRQMRSSMLTSLGADYVRTARAKGLTENTVVLKHALRNSLITVTTIVGIQLGALISGVVVTESIFVIPASAGSRSTRSASVTTRCSRASCSWRPRDMSS